MQSTISDRPDATTHDQALALQGQLVEVTRVRDGVRMPYGTVINVRAMTITVRSHNSGLHIHPANYPVGTVALKAVEFSRRGNYYPLLRQSVVV